jgi:hypothetical protein
VLAGVRRKAIDLGKKGGQSPHCGAVCEAHLSLDVCKREDSPTMQQPAATLSVTVEFLGIRQIRIAL